MFSVFSVLSTIMPEPATIDDLLNKRRLENPGEEVLVARQLRKEKRTLKRKVEVKIEVKEKPGKEGEGEEKPKEEEKPREKPEEEEKPGGKGEGKDKPEGENKPGKEGEGKDKPGEEGEGKDKPEGENKPREKGEGGEKPGDGNKEDEGKEEEKPGAKGEGGEKPGEKGEGKDKPEGEEKPGEKGEGARGQPGNVGGGIDSQLLAGQLREEKNKERERREAGGEKGEEAGKNPEGEEDGGGWRDRINQLKEKANLKKRAQKKIEEKVTAPARQGTNRLLCLAWENLIDSFGATLLYINLHVFLRWVLGEKLFCKLGEEWIPKGAQAVGGEAGKTGGKAIGLVEVIGLLILDLIALFIIGSVLALIVMIVDFMEKGVLGKAGAVIGGLTGLGWSGVKALFDLLKGA